MSDSLFGSEPDPARRDQAIVDAYAQAGRTLDDLPYTDEFETVMVLVRETDAEATHRDVFHRLHNLRKAGKLMRLGRAASAPPRLDCEHERLLMELVTGAAGNMGQRDRLPFTDEFDTLAAAFNTRTGLQLTHHDLWRVIAKLAK